jgi:hypothetical protein
MTIGTFRETHHERKLVILCEMNDLPRAGSPTMTSSTFSSLKTSRPDAIASANGSRSGGQPPSLSRFLSASVATSWRAWRTVTTRNGALFLAADAPPPPSRARHTLREIPRVSEVESRAPRAVGPPSHRPSAGI